MSQFLSFFEGRQINWTDGRPIWWSLAPLPYQSDRLGVTVLIPAEFISDLASVPRVPVLWLMAGGRGTRSAVLHDFPYQFGYWLLDGENGRIEVTRALADDVFYESLLADPISGAGPVQAWEMWAGVRAGGHGVWQDRQRRSPVLNPEWSRDWGILAP